MVVMSPLLKCDGFDIKHREKFAIDLSTVECGWFDDKKHFHRETFPVDCLIGYEAIR